MGQLVLDDIEIGIFFSFQILFAEGHAANGRVKSAHGKAIVLAKSGMAIEWDTAENRCSQEKWDMNQ
jgi:hypothetical protein